MFCPQCGTRFTETLKLCPNCRQSYISLRLTLGTKWLNFRNYFILPLGGVLQLIDSLTNNNDLPAISIIGIAIAIFQYIVAYGLHHGRLWAWDGTGF